MDVALSVPKSGTVQRSRIETPQEFRVRSRRRLLNFSLTVLIAAASSFSGGEAAFADTQTAPSGGDQGAPQQQRQYDPDYNGDDVTRPERKFQLLLESKSSGTTTKTERKTIYLQPEVVLDLDAGWGLSLLAKVPITWKSSKKQGAAESTSEFGPGDIEVEGALFRPINERWAYGFGARLVAPSAEDTIGNSKWQIMPGFGVRYSFLQYGPNTYFVPKMRYAMSFGGDPSARNISEIQLAPTLNIGLPDRWFVTLFPSYDIRISYGEPESGQTGRLFLPFDASIGRKLGDSIVVSLEVGVPIIKDYPVYKLRVELR